MFLFYNFSSNHSQFVNRKQFEKWISAEISSGTEITFEDY